MTKNLNRCEHENSTSDNYWKKSHTKYTVITGDILSAVSQKSVSLCDLQKQWILIMEHPVYYGLFIYISV